MLHLNEIVIEKSALYLKVDRYIENVKDRTNVEDPEIVARRERRRIRKYKNNQVADLDAIRMTTSVNDFLMRNSEIESMTCNAKGKKSAMDEEIKAQYDDISDSYITNNKLSINFESVEYDKYNSKIDLDATKDSRNRFLSSSPQKKLQSFNKRSKEISIDKQSKIRKLSNSPDEKRLHNSTENNLMGEILHLYPSMKHEETKSPFKNQKSVKQDSEQIDNKTDDSADVDAEELHAFHSLVRTIQNKEQQNRLKRDKVGLIPQMTIKRNKSIDKQKSARLVKQGIEKLESSIDLDSMIDEQTFGNEYATVQNPTINNFTSTDSPTKNLMVKAKKSKGAKVNSRLLNEIKNHTFRERYAENAFTNDISNNVFMQDLHEGEADFSINLSPDKMPQFDQDQVDSKQNESMNTSREVFDSYKKRLGIMK